MSLRRRLVGFLILILLVLAARAGLNFALGAILRSVFAAGTGCDVSLARPQVNFFPLTMSVENVRIHHPHEPADHDFAARRVSVRVHTLRTLHRELLLSDLVLEGAGAASIGTETGFMKTLGFLFPVEPPAAPREEHSGWWQDWLRSWKFHVSTIRIDSDPGRESGLLIEVGQQRLVWRDVHLSFDEQQWDPKLPYDVVARGNDLRFLSGNISPIALGPLDIDGVLGLGKLEVRQATLHPLADPDGSSVIGLTGILNIRPPGRFDFNFHWQYDREPLEDLLTRVQVPEVFRPSGGTGTFHLGGSYADPELTGSVLFSFGSAALFGLRDGCGVESIGGDLTLNRHGLSVQKFRMEDLVREGKFALAFEDQRKTDVELELHLNRELAWMQRCLLAQPSGIAPAARPGSPGTSAQTGSSDAYGVVGDFLADSTTTVRLSGTTAPLDLRGTLHSNAAVERRNLHTEVDAQFSLNAAVASLRLEEHGLTPQIQAQQAATGRVRTVPAPPQTSFTRAVNSNLELGLTYHRNDDTLEIEKASLVRYPTLSLLARLAPFLSERQFAALRGGIEPESLLQCTLSGTVAAVSDTASRALSLSGSIESSAIRVLETPLTRVSIPLKMQGSRIEVTRAAIELYGGALQISGSAAPGKPLSATFDITDVRLTDDERLRALLPGIEANLDGKGTVEGTLEQPKMTAALDVESTRPGISRAIRHSHVDAVVKPDGVSVIGALIDNTARIEANVPLSGKAEQPFVVKLDAADVPVGYFTPPAQGNGASAHASPTLAPGALTGHLEFTGPRSDPLSGKGKITVSKFDFPAQGISLASGQSVEAEIRAGAILFTNVRFAVHGRELKLTGSADRSRGWNSHLEGQWELGALVGFVPGVEQISGALQLNVDIAGPLAEPQPSGTLRIDHGSVSLPLGDTVVGVERGTVVAVLDKGDLTLQQLDGFAGGGGVSGSGVVRHVLSPDERESHLSLRMHDLIVEPIPKLALDLDGSLNAFQNPGQPLRLTGSIEIERATYEQQLSVLEMATALARGIFERRKRIESGDAGEPPNLQMEIRIVAPSGVVVETPVAQAELRVDATVRGTPRDLRADGKVKVTEGTFGLQSTQFEVLNGQVTFSPDRRPGEAELSLVGEATVNTASQDEYRLQMILSGTLLEPRVDFSSDAGLRREEIQAMLGLGTSIQAFDILRPTKEVRSLQEIINPSSGLGIRDRLQGLTGFTSVQLETAQSQVTGEYVPRLVGRRPLFGSVEVQLATQLGSEQGNEARFQVPLRTHLDFLSGWYSPAVTRPGSSTGGSFYGGVSYRRTFAGGYVLPTSLFSGGVNP